MDLYTRKTYHMTSLIILVLGGLLLGIKGFFNLDVFQFLLKRLGTSVVTIIYITFGLAAIVNLFSRDYYLPFLGDAAYPCGSLLEKTPRNADTTVYIRSKPNSSVIYWAAESNRHVQPNPWMAYAANTNAGVALSDQRGKTVLKVRKPTSYRTPLGNMLNPHIHYRVCEGKGMLGRVQTVFINV